MNKIICTVCTTGELTKLKNFYICEDCGTNFPFEVIESTVEENFIGYENRINKLYENLKIIRKRIDTVVVLPDNPGPKTKEFVEFNSWLFNDIFRRTFDMCESDIIRLERELDDYNRLYKIQVEIDNKAQSE